MSVKPEFMKGVKALCFFSAAIITATISFTACNNHEDKTAGTTTDTTVVVQNTTDTAQIKADWEKFKTDAGARIKESDDSIAAFKKKTQKFNGKMKIKYDKEASLLERKNDTLKMKLDNFKYETKDKWIDFKTGFNKDMDELKAWLRDSTKTSR